MGSLPALRRALDVMPSPDENHPGLLLRDPLGYSENTLVCPPPLVPFLRYFDGEHQAGTLEAALRESGAGDQAGPLAAHLLESLAKAGFLDDAGFAVRRAEKHAHFARAPRRDAAHAGGAYPDDAGELKALLESRLLDDDRTSGSPPAVPVRPRRLLGIAAPHASPDGAWDSYRAAYRKLEPADASRTLVVLGTSHYGAANRFGLTRKPYVTPLGEAATDTAFVDALVEAGGPAVVEEDYCHAVEHSIEFQVVFLQHVLGAAARIVPLLCGPLVPPRAEERWAEGLSTPGAGAPAEEVWPEDDPAVAQFLGALRALCVSRPVLFVLGVDLAHIGRRYGDRLKARAGEGVLTEVEKADRMRAERLVAGDAAGFWSRVSYGGDPLNWCGTSPLYTFLRAAPPVGGEVLHYEQWQIDAESVVSCAGLAFYEAPAPEV